MKDGRVIVSLQDNMASQEAWGRIVVRAPNWVGDLVMATPMLRALRRGLPRASISILLKRHLFDVLRGLASYDELIPVDTRKGAGRLVAIARTGLQLRPRKFDLGILLTNSFSSAVELRLGAVTHRLGYAVNCRRFLVNDPVRLEKDTPGACPLPLLDVYLNLAKHVGCDATDRAMELAVAPQAEEHVEDLLRKEGLKDGDGLLTINPAAAYGPARCWAAERYAQLADVLSERFGSPVLINWGPGERPLALLVRSRMRQKPLVLGKPALTLEELKALMKRSMLLVTNDTGPRHIAKALGTPVVTLFGPTDPRKTEAPGGPEIALVNETVCQPCKHRICPTDQRCMTETGVEEVLEAARKLLSG